MQGCGGSLVDAVISLIHCLVIIIFLQPGPAGENAMTNTEGQDIFADMIFSRISWILTKPRKYHVGEQGLYDLLT